MEDLSQMLQNLLQTEDGKQGFAQAMSMLNGKPAKEDSPSPTNDKTESGSPLPFDPKIFLQLQKMMSNIPSHDKNTDFLRALKPLLKQKRQSRIDEAIHMMRLFSLLPVMQQSGILKNLLSFGDI